MSRYLRQTTLEEVGEAGQARLSAARVLVIGAGGLTASALPALAGAGVGRLTVVDGDQVELSNLHRQTLFREADAGRPKAEAAVAACAALNAQLTAQALIRPLTPDNADDLVRSSDIVLDCADSYAVSYTLSDTCLRHAVPLVTASVLRFGGYVAGFCGTAPSLRAVFPDAPANAADCATAGVMGPVVAMLGAAQAQMTLAAILDLQPSPLGQMLQIDMRSYRLSGFRFDGATEPPDFFAFVSAASLAASDLVVDLRDEAEAAEPFHPAARRIAPQDLASELEPESRRLVLACASGLRAWRAAEALKDTWPGEIVLAAAKAT